MVLPDYGGFDMIQIDPMYLYKLGHSLHPLEAIKADESFQQWLYPLFMAKTELPGFLHQSVFQLRSSRPSGLKLNKAIESLLTDYQRDTVITLAEAYSITSALAEFEHALTAEFGVTILYLVQKRRGHDPADLVNSGEVIFPEDLPLKVPEAVDDLRQATRCIAFDLPTAAGFHLHRANESVLRRWYDAVTNGRKRPMGRNIGDYLQELNSANSGNPKVRSAMKDLKDLHRNPLIHPDQSIDSIDDALALMGSIHAVVASMLKDIPLLETSLESTPVAVT